MAGPKKPAAPYHWPTPVPAPASVPGPVTVPDFGTVIQGLGREMSARKDKEVFALLERSMEAARKVLGDDPCPPVLRFTYEWLRMPEFLWVPYGTSEGNKVPPSCTLTPAPFKGLDPGRPLLALVCPRTLRVLAMSEFGENFGDLRGLAIKNHWDYLRAQHAERMLDYNLAKIRFVETTDLAAVPHTFPWPLIPDKKKESDIKNPAFLPGVISNWSSVEKMLLVDRAHHLLPGQTIWDQEGLNRAISTMAARLAAVFPDFRHSFREQIDYPDAAYSWAKNFRDERHLVREIAVRERDSRRNWLFSWPEDRSLILDQDPYSSALGVWDALDLMSYRSYKYKYNYPRTMPATPPTPATQGSSKQVPNEPKYICLHPEVDFGSVERRFVDAFGKMPTTTTKRLRKRPCR